MQDKIKDKVDQAIISMFNPGYKDKNAKEVSAIDEEMKVSSLAYY